MEIRKVKLSEAAGVLSLIEQFDRVVAPRPDAAQVAAVFEAIEGAGGAVIGAFSGGQMVGTCTLSVCANLSWSGRPYAIIENVIVARDQRGQGTGRQLMAYAQAHAQRRGCYKVALMTESGDPAVLSFYRACGFSADKTGFQMRFSA